MHNIVLHISIYLFPGYMCYTISDPLIMTENNKSSFPKKIYMCSYAHNVSMKMSFCDWTVNILTFTPPNLLYVYQNNS